MRIRIISLKKSDYLFYIFVILFLLSVFTGSANYPIFAYSAEVVSLLSLWAIFLTKTKQKGFYIGYDRTLCLLFLLQIIYILIGYFTYSYYPSRTLTYAIRHILLFPFLFVSINEEYLEKILTISRCYIMLANFIYLILYPILGNNGSIFGTYQYVATYSSILAVGILAKMFAFNSFDKKDYFQLGISVLVVLATGKRSFVIVIVLIALIGTLFIKNNRKHKRVTKILMLGLIFGGFIFLIKPEIFESIIRIKALGDTDVSLSGRTNLWDLALYLWHSSPLHGIGYGTFSRFTDENMSFVYSRFGVQRTYAAHNIYLQLLAETGVIGFSIFMLLFIVALIKTIKKLKLVPRVCYKDRMYLVMSLFIQLWFLIYGLSGNDLYMAGQLMLYILSMSIIWTRKKRGNSE